MIPLEETVAILLCAGLSRRYGAGNKLLAPLAGEPLVAHAAGLCARVPFAGRIAIVRPNDTALAALLGPFDLDLVANPDPEAGKDSSLRLGLGAALTRRPRGVLVLLGDMPHIAATHLHALSAAADDGTAAISRAGETTSPPTLIPAELAGRALHHIDRPVRESLGRLVDVAAPSSMLVDYDRPEHFAREADWARNKVRCCSSEGA